jgi:hypothetical protein
VQIIADQITIDKKELVMALFFNFNIFFCLDNALDSSDIDNSVQDTRAYGPIPAEQYLYQALSDHKLFELR